MHCTEADLMQRKHMLYALPLQTWSKFLVSKGCMLLLLRALLDLQ
jgi:hypothetical protein